METVEPLCGLAHPSREGVKCARKPHDDGVHVAYTTTPSEYVTMSWYKWARTRGDLERKAARTVLARL